MAASYLCWPLGEALIACSHTNKVCSYCSPNLFRHHLFILQVSSAGFFSPYKPFKASETNRVEWRGFRYLFLPEWPCWPEFDKLNEGKWGENAFACKEWGRSITGCGIASFFPRLQHVGADTESVCCLQLTGDGAGASYARLSYTSLYVAKLTVNLSQQWYALH